MALPQLPASAKRPAPSAETVARETGAKTAVLNPIEGLTKNEVSKGENYFSLMRTNLRSLREGLGCS